MWEASNAHVNKSTDDDGAHVRRLSRSTACGKALKSAAVVVANPWLMIQESHDMFTARDRLAVLSDGCCGTTVDKISFCG